MLAAEVGRAGLWLLGFGFAGLSAYTGGTAISLADDAFRAKGSRLRRARVLAVAVGALALALGTLAGACLSFNALLR